MTLSPSLYWHALNSRIPVSFQMTVTTGLAAQLASFQLRNCFGKGLSWAQSGLAPSSAIPQTKSDSRRIPCYRLDTNRLPLVPGLFNRGSRRRTARAAFSRQIQRHAVQALQIT